MFEDESKKFLGTQWESRGAGSRKGYFLVSQQDGKPKGKPIKWTCDEEMALWYMVS